MTRLEMLKKQIAYNDNYAATIRNHASKHEAAGDVPVAMMFLMLESFIRYQGALLQIEIEFEEQPKPEPKFGRRLL